MKRFLLLSLLTWISMVSTAQRKRISFDDNWKFSFGHAGDAAKDFNPVNDIKKDILTEPSSVASNEPPKPKPADDETYEGPVSR